MSEVITGYRGYFIESRSPRLRGLYQTPVDGKVSPKAECMDTLRNHSEPAPHEPCECGFYGKFLLADMILHADEQYRYWPIAIARVSAIGKVVIYDNGVWRAEQVRIEELYSRDQTVCRDLGEFLLRPNHPYLNLRWGEGVRNIRMEDVLRPIAQELEVPLVRIYENREDNQNNNVRP